MMSYLIRRGLGALVTLAVFVSVVFFGVNLLVPYDYATTYWLQGGLPLVEAIREQVGLNRSIWERYFDQMSGLLQGDLGFSFGGGRVTELVVDALPVTLLAFAVGGVVAYLFGDWLGRVVAWHRSRGLSGAASTASVGLYTAFPPSLVFLLVYFGSEPIAKVRSAAGLVADREIFWAQSRFSEAEVTTVVAAGLVAVLVLALAVRAVARREGMRWIVPLALPVALAGGVAAVISLGIGTEALQVLLRLGRVGSGEAGNPLIAAIALALIAFGEVTMVVRAGMDDEIREDYVKTARAKGLPDLVIRDRHVGRNAVLPVMARIVTGVPYLLTGLIIIERELALPGLSSVFFDAIETVDVPLIVGMLIVIGLLVLVLRLLLDVLHAALDPRIRFAREQT